MYFHPRRSDTAGCFPFKVFFVLILGLVSFVCIAALPIVSTELDESHPHLARRAISWDVEVTYKDRDVPPHLRQENLGTIRHHIEDGIRSQLSRYDIIRKIKFASNGIPEFVNDMIMFDITWKSVVEVQGGPRTTGGYIHFVGNKSPTMYRVAVRAPIHWQANVMFVGERVGFPKVVTNFVKNEVEKAIRDNIAQCKADTVQSVSFPGQWLSSYDKELKMHFHIDWNDETRSTGYVERTAKEQPYVVHLNGVFVPIAADGSASTSASRIPQINVIEASPPIPGQCMFPQFEHQRRTLG
ncbi:hypothetical protein C8R41DRAFT_925422 [Lentinula lateritia]|uniref:Uncharacterized protein n=1 Tax=Lentinula lateritia TaxID=40482 RepID=A0ABQ8V4L6_9AGAR|nr:hypothetical protein C8R41DRAFT_925422 [Lentinula lateritia]